jgi:hypothetical protein
VLDTSSTHGTWPGHRPDTDLMPNWPGPRWTWPLPTWLTSPAARTRPPTDPSNLRRRAPAADRLAAFRTGRLTHWPRRVRPRRASFRLRAHAGSTSLPWAADRRRLRPIVTRGTSCRARSVSTFRPPGHSVVSERAGTPNTRSGLGSRPTRPVARRPGSLHVKVLRDCVPSPNASRRAEVRPTSRVRCLAVRCILTTPASPGGTSRLRTCQGSLHDLHTLTPPSAKAGVL